MTAICFRFLLTILWELVILVWEFYMLKSNIDVFFVTSFLCSLKFVYFFSNRVSKEVSMKFFFLWLSFCDMTTFKKQDTVPVTLTFDLWRSDRPDEKQISTLRWHSRTWPNWLYRGIRSRWRSVRGVFMIQVKITASWCRSFVSQEGGGHSQVWTKLDKVIVIYLQINKCAIREMNMISHDANHLCSTCSVFVFTTKQNDRNE